MSIPFCLYFNIYASWFLFYLTETIFTPTLAWIHCGDSNFPKKSNKSFQTSIPPVLVAPLTIWSSARGPITPSSLQKHLCSRLSPQDPIVYKNIQFYSTPRCRRLAGSSPAANCGWSRCGLAPNPSHLLQAVSYPSFYCYHAIFHCKQHFRVC